MGEPLPADTNPTGFTAWCDHAHPILAVPCPLCLARAGEWCVMASGRPSSTLHARRRTLAEEIFRSTHGDMASIERTPEGFAVVFHGRTRSKWPIPALWKTDRAVHERARRTPDASPATADAAAGCPAPRAAPTAAGPAVARLHRRPRQLSFDDLVR